MPRERRTSLAAKKFPTDGIVIPYRAYRPYYTARGRFSGEAVKRGYKQEGAFSRREMSRQMGMMNSTSSQNMCARGNCWIIRKPDSPTPEKSALPWNTRQNPHDLIRFKYGTKRSTHCDRYMETRMSGHRCTSHTWGVLRDPKVGDCAILDELGLQVGHGNPWMQIPDVCDGKLQAEYEPGSDTHNKVTRRYAPDSKRSSPSDNIRDDGTILRLQQETSVILDGCQKQVHRPGAQQSRSDRNCACRG